MYTGIDTYELIDLAGGNPGATRALIDYIKLKPTMYAQLAVTLHTADINGSAVYVLFNDICDYDYDLLHYIVKVTDPIKLHTACNKQYHSGKLILQDELREYFNRNLES